jgi:hypothetical protein
MTENPRLKALQAILTEAQVVVECPTEMAERLPSIGFHTHSELDTLLT